MDWYFEALRKYAQFSGRSLRPEYWVFFVVNLVLYFATAFVDLRTGNVNEKFGIGLMGGVFTLVVLLPSLAVAVRRLHDTNRSAWWLLLALLPLIGPLILFVFYSLEGTRGDNDYGPDPRLTAAEITEQPAEPAPPEPPADPQNG